jgi:hypothetical protein
VAHRVSPALAWGEHMLCHFNIIFLLNISLGLYIDIRYGECEREVGGGEAVRTVCAHVQQSLQYSMYRSVLHLL